MTDKHRLLYKVTAKVANPPLLIQRHYSFTSGTEAKEFLAYCQRNGVEAEIIFSRNDTLETAKADIDREIRLAGQRLYA